MEIITFFATIIIGILVQVTVGDRINFPGLGQIIATSFIGSMILWNIRHRCK